MNIEEQISVREQARQDKDWELCDSIRNYLDTQNVFIFDTKSGQEIHYLTNGYFSRKDKALFTEAMTNRQYVEYIIKRDIRAENNFDAWLYSQKKDADRFRVK